MRKNTRIYYPNKILEASEISLEKKQSHYIKNVMRLKEGSYLSIFNENEGEYNCKILNIKKDIIKLQILNKIKNQLNSFQFSLAFCPPKKIKLDILMQKATELGIKSFYPLISNRTINRDINLSRLEKIIIETIEQSDQCKIPKIFNPRKFDNFINEIAYSNDNLLSVKDHIDSKKNLFILIGPEGDFDPDELLAINKCKNAIKFSLGKSILRSETAAISAISIFNYLSRQI